ncbi:MAG: hypothetical protein ACREIA_19830, partial [Opitutaceae bacterium]
MNEGQLPVSPALLVALAIGFGLFNQILFAVLGAAVVGEGRVETGGKLVWISLALGGGVFAALMTLAALAKPRRATDLAAALPTAGLFAGAIAQAVTDAPGPAAWLLLAGNAWFALWLARGWARRFWARPRKGAADGNRSSP